MRDFVGIPQGRSDLILTSSKFCYSFINNRGQTTFISILIKIKEQMGSEHYRTATRPL